MFGQMAKAMAIMVVGLIVISGVFLAKAGSSASAAPSPDNMTRKDVFGSVRLTAAERASGVETCNRRFDVFSAAQSQARRKQNLGVTEPARRFCECFVNQIEDRSSRLQYAMAMTVLDKGYLFSSPNAFGTFQKYKSAAERHGMSADDIETMRRDLGSSMKMAAEQCARNMFE